MIFYVVWGILTGTRGIPIYRFFVCFESRWFQLLFDSFSILSERGEETGSDYTGAGFGVGGFCGTAGFGGRW